MRKMKFVLDLVRDGEGLWKYRMFLGICVIYSKENNVKVFKI